MSTQKPSPAENRKVDVPHVELIPIGHHDALTWLGNHAGQPATVHIQVHLGDRSTDVLTCEGVLTAVYDLGGRAGNPAPDDDEPAYEAEPTHDGAGNPAPGRQITVGPASIPLTELARMPVATAGTDELQVDLDQDVVMRIVARPRVISPRAK